MRAHIKPAVQYQFGQLTTASQPDVLDHTANPSATIRDQPPLANSATVDYYLLAQRPSTSVHQANNPTHLHLSQKLS
jgi:hypothetical protein